MKCYIAGWRDMSAGRSRRNQSQLEREHEIMRAGERISGINVKNVRCIQTFVNFFPTLVMETFRKTQRGTELILFPENIFHINSD